MNLESKHTPGPWEVIENSWSDTSILKGNETIASMSIYDEATEETQEALEIVMAANAHLISATPEAIEFIADLLNILDYHTGEPQNINISAGMIEQAENILKKAYNL